MLTPQPWKVFTIVTAATLLPRLIFVVVFPGGGGDTVHIYQSVALNILQNGCVSLSDPASGICTPHWGGNQLPGYPFFLYLVWSVFGISWLHANIIQTLLLTTAICLLVRAIHRLRGEWYSPLAVGLVMALSPLQLPWSRMALTETLSFAAIIWLFAELIHSLALRRLRVWPLGISMVAALFIRYDNVFVCLAIAIVAFYLHTPKQALMRGGFIAAIVAAPLFIWTVRNTASGLDAIPSSIIMKGQNQPPLGYIKWGKSWSINQYQYPSWLYPITGRNYKAISIDSSVYNSEQEKELVENLLRELRTYQGKPFPNHIDVAFARLAQARHDQNPIWYSLGVRLQRSWNTWFNLKASSGWPVSIAGLHHVGADRHESDSYSRLKALAFENPFSAAVRGITGIYRIGLFAALAVALIYSIRVNLGVVGPIIWCASAIALGRLFLFAILDVVETRYALGAVPGIEIALCLIALNYLRKKYPAK